MTDAPMVPPGDDDPQSLVAEREDPLALNITRGVTGLTGLGVGGLTLTRVLGTLPTSTFGWIWAALGTVVAVLLLTFAATGGSRRGRDAMKSAVVGATVLGGVSFAAGFLGPLILTPDANQGPLLGILMTGPAGVAAGALGGLLYGLLRSGPGRYSPHPTFEPSKDDLS